MRYERTGWLLRLAGLAVALSVAHAGPEAPLAGWSKTIATGRCPSVVF
jgi:hypothetical protein